MPESLNLKRRRDLKAFLVCRDGRSCRYCGREMTTVPSGRRGCARDTDMTFDHVIPRVRGGQTKPSNLVLACYACNRSKGDRLLSEWASPIDRSMVRFREVALG